MKKNCLSTAILAVGLLTACGNSTKSNKSSESQRTVETEKLLANLKKTSKKGIMFGHQDDTVYGIGWDGDKDRSDVHSLVDDYPAVIGFDLGHIEVDDSVNLDSVSFNKIREEIVNQYNRGGLSTVSWHVRNPLTGGDSWDVSDATVVKSVLVGGSQHEKFIGWLDRLAGYLNSLTTADGIKVPVLFRPWHEHTGSWFWWGKNLCSVEDYKALWNLTTQRMKANNVNNLLYVYSPGTEPKTTAEYLERYPCNDLIDVIGFDTYQFNKEIYLANMSNALTLIDSIGNSYDKVIAITETGYEALPDATWWTETLLPAMNNYPISYVLVWRNAREKVAHYYAPYPGQMSADDFKEFYKNPKTLFAKDVNSLYK